MSTDVSHGNKFLDSIVGGKPDDPDVTHKGGGVAGNIEYRCDLLDPVSLLTIANIMYEGAKKGRADGGWRKLPAIEHINHGMTHLLMHMAGSKTEDHLGKALTRLMMAVGVDRGSIEHQATISTICLCGSTKFKKQYLEIAKLLALESGFIVLSCEFFMHSDDCQITPEEKKRLDELHLRKIDMADAIYVVNVGGYIGESTRNEIRYAKEKGKTIFHYEPVEPVKREPRV